MRTAAGRCSAARRQFQQDPLWRDHLPFYEYFHGDNGAGLGASHQTGWSALVAELAQMFGNVNAETMESDKAAAIRASQREELARP